MAARTVLEKTVSGSKPCEHTSEASAALVFVRCFLTVDQRASIFCVAAVDFLDLKGAIVENPLDKVRACGQ